MEELHNKIFQYFSSNKLLGEEHLRQILVHLLSSYKYLQLINVEYAEDDDWKEAMVLISQDGDVFRVYNLSIGIDKINKTLSTDYGVLYSRNKN